MDTARALANKLWGDGAGDDASTQAVIELPTRRDEAWKYLNLRSIVEGVSARAQQAVNGGGEVTSGGTQAVLGVARDIGSVIAAATDDVVSLRAAGGGIAVSPQHLQRLRSECEVVNVTAGNVPAWVRAAVEQTCLPSDIELGAGALARSRLGEPLAIRVPAGVELGAVLDVGVQVGAEPSSAALWLYLEEGAQATVIEHYSGAPPALVADGLTSMHLGVVQAAGSRLDMGTIAAHGERGRVIAARGWHVGQGASMASATLNLSGGIFRQHGVARIAGTDVDADFDVLMSLGGRAHSDVLLRVLHDAPDCRSNQRVRAVLREAARGAFQGKIEVASAAQRTDAYQQADARLMSPHAAFDSKPELEIYADDVKCSHGSTTSALDEEHVFYMASRGISRAVAEAMLLEGLLCEIIDGNRSPLIARVMRAAAGFAGGESVREA